jgi:hypothetical protein
VRGIPEDIVAGGQGRGGTAVTWSAFTRGAVLCLAALLALICPIFADSPSVRKTTVAPVPDAQQQFGAGAIFGDE